MSSVLGGILKKFGSPKHPILEIDTKFLMVSLNKLYESSKKKLDQNSHPVVLENLIFFIENDILLRSMIYEQIVPHSGVLNQIPEEKLNEIIELQTYFNLYRNNLIGKILDYLFTEYNKIINVLTDYDYALELYKYVKFVNDFYYRSLEQYFDTAIHKPIYFSNIKEEMMNIFHESFKASLITLQGFIKYSNYFKE